MFILCQILYFVLGPHINERARCGEAAFFENIRYDYPLVKYTELLEVRPLLVKPNTPINSKMNICYSARAARPDISILIVVWTH